jgi:hypothetical protein
VIYLPALAISQAVKWPLVVDESVRFLIEILIVHLPRRTEGNDDVLNLRWAGPRFKPEMSRIQF